MTSFCCTAAALREAGLRVVTLCRECAEALRADSPEHVPAGAHWRCATRLRLLMRAANALVCAPLADAAQCERFALTQEGMTLLLVRESELRECLGAAQRRLAERLIAATGELRAALMRGVLQLNCSAERIRRHRVWMASLGWARA